MTKLAEQLKRLDPMYPNPSCYWDKDEQRIAILFHREHAGREVLKLIGDSTRIDDLAKLLARIQAEEPQTEQGKP